MQSAFARDTKNIAHNNNKCAGSDRKSTLPLKGVHLGFYLLIFIVVLKESRVDETATKRGGKSLVERGEHSKPSPPTQRQPPASARSARVCSRALLFLLLLNRISRWREREREGRNTHAAGVVWDLSRWRKKTGAFGRARLRASVEQLSSLSLIRSREI